MNGHFTANLRLWCGAKHILLQDIELCAEEEFQPIGQVMIFLRKNDILLTKNPINDKPFSTTSKFLSLDESKMRILSYYESPLSSGIFLSMDISSTEKHCYFFQKIQQQFKSEISFPMDVDDSNISDKEFFSELQNDQVAILFLQKLHTKYPEIPLSASSKKILFVKTKSNKINCQWRKSFSAKKFYGYGSQKKIKTLTKFSLWEQMYEKLQFNIARSTLCQFEGSTPVSYVFGRQKEAFHYVDQIVSYRKKNFKKEYSPRVFCFECAKEGKRRFLVSEMDHFWQEYSTETTKVEERHVYEIIREGLPCRLYMDLEFHQKINPTIQGEVLVDHIINLVALGLYVSLHFFY
jgi:hypothetical protein